MLRARPPARPHRTRAVTFHRAGGSSCAPSAATPTVIRAAPPALQLAGHPNASSAATTPAAGSPAISTTGGAGTLAARTSTAPSDAPHRATHEMGDIRESA